MKKELFDELIESVQEASAIGRGEIKPSRVFQYPASSASRQPLEQFAICIMTDDLKLLQPRKIYRVSILSNNLVKVVDEVGEVAIYPADHFILVDLSREIEEALATHDLKS